MKKLEERLVRYFIFAVLLMIVARMIFINDTISWLSNAMTPIVIMLITIYFMEPLVQRYQKSLIKNYKKRKPQADEKGFRTTAVVLSFLTLLLIVAGFISIVLPSIMSSVTAIIDQLPNSTDQFVDIILGIPFVSLFIDVDSLYSVFNSLNELFVSFGQNIISYSTNIIISFKDAIVAVGIFILSLLMAFYALRDYEDIGDNIELHLRSLFGDSIMDPLIRVFHMTDKSMKKFLIGKLYTCLFLGLMVGIFGLIFNIFSPKDIPYLPLIAFIIGITNIIPYVGPLLGTIPSIVFALINGFIPAVALLAIVLIAQQVDNILVSPKVLGDSVGLKPFWILLSVTVGGRLFGILGMLLTVPIASVILVLLDERAEKYKANKNVSKKSVD